MVNVESRAPSTPMILGIVGGIALAIGSFLNWATVSVDFDKIATAIGIDPADVPADVRAQGTVSVTGWKGGDGKWTLVAGVVVVVAAVLLSMASSRRVVGIVMLVGGVVGGGLALYDATIQKNDAIDNAASTFAGIGLPGELRDYFSISLGIGLYLCIAGGVVAIVAGIMAMMSQQPVAAMAGDPAGFVPPPPVAPDGGFAAGGVWTGMPESGSAMPESGSAMPESGEPPAAGTTMSDVESAMPEADVSKEPDAGSGTGVPAPPAAPPEAPAEAPRDDPPAPS
jgi:hypothetical protein